MKSPFRRTNRDKDKLYTAPLADVHPNCGEFVRDGLVENPTIRCELVKGHPGPHANLSVGFVGAPGGCVSVYTAPPPGGSFQCKEVNHILKVDGKDIDFDLPCTLAGGHDGLHKWDWNNWKKHAGLHEVRPETVAPRSIEANLAAILAEIAILREDFSESHWRHSRRLRELGEKISQLGVK